MKIRILPILVAGVMAATAFLSSCLGNDYDDIEYPAESSITAFSIGTLHQTFYVKSSKGEDSVYTDTISYADVPFTIDQINRKIYNKLIMMTLPNTATKLIHNFLETPCAAWSCRLDANLYIVGLKAVTAQKRSNARCLCYVMPAL